MKTTDADYQILLESFKTHAKNAIKERYWHDLCCYIRQWLMSYCPLYNRDEIELIIGSWVTRQIIIQDQIEARGGLGSHCTRPNQMAGESTEGKICAPGTSGFFSIWHFTPETELQRELDAFWDNLLPTYERTIKSKEEYPPAEKKVDEVLARIARRKKENT